MSDAIGLVVSVALFLVMVCWGFSSLFEVPSTINLDDQQIVEVMRM